MALGTPTVLASATPVSTTDITTGSFTPTADALVIVCSFNTGQTSDNGQGSVASTHSPALSWTAVTVEGGGNTTGGVRAWWAIAPSSPGSGTVTVSNSDVPSIQDVSVIEITGADPTTPVEGRGGAQASTATTISTNTSTTPTTDDYKLGLVVNRNKSSAPTVGTGYTSVDSAASSSPSASYLIEYRASDTGTTVDAGNVGTVWSGIIGLVIKAAASGPTTYPVSGTSAVVADAVGAPALLGAVSGSSSVVADAVGSPAAILGVSGTSPASSTLTGLPALLAAISGTSAAVSELTGAPIMLAVASGQSDIITDLIGDPTIIPGGGGAVTYPVSGTTAIVADSVGLPSLLAAVSGTSVASSTLAGIPALLASVSGASSAITELTGAPAAIFQISGQSDIVTQLVGLPGILTGIYVAVYTETGWVSYPILEWNGTSWVAPASLTAL